MLTERFWSKVRRGTDDECWVWTAHHNGVGYGMFRPGGTAPKKLAHRLSYEFHCGPIPEGACVLHHCDNPSCVNPSHLFLGDYKANTQDMMRKGRHRYVLPPNARPPITRGADHYKAKLNDELVARYREELAAGKPLRQLARETGLDRKTLMAMRDRVTWRHVP